MLPAFIKPWNFGKNVWGEVANGKFLFMHWIAVSRVNG